MSDLLLGDQPAHVITGATGFVGSAIILELLRKTNAKIVGVVRSPDDQLATQRLHDVLLPLVGEYELSDHLRHEIENRVSAVAGDIEQALCGTEPRPEMMGAEFWHSAASLRFLDRHWEQIERTNVLGTSNAIALGRQLGCTRFNMISTAYVAGYRSGVVAAEPAPPGFANNRYEESKVAAERLVSNSGLSARIMRPGVVIGHSRTKYSNSVDGLYGLVRALIKFRGVLERSQAGLAGRRRVRIVGDERSTIDLVPVDHVAAEAVALSIAEAPSDFYHLTNVDPPSTGDAIRQSFLSAGLLAPEIVDDDSGFDAMERKLHKRLTFYTSYLINPKRFDRRSVDRALGAAACTGFVLPAEGIRQFCDWYSQRFEMTRPALPPVR